MSHSGRASLTYWPAQRRKYAAAWRRFLLPAERLRRSAVQPCSCQPQI